MESPMFAQLATHYLWWILALLLIVFELVLPGYFMLWIGFAAALMGVLLLIAPGLSLLAQALAFALLGFASCLLYWYGVRPRLQQVGSGGLLNRRAAQLIGQRYVLVEPIINGRGKAQVGDSLWLVSGEDLPLGRTVEVIAVDGTTLQVRPVS
jgi:membrane protein implicated in regulation of membrane protease activity